MFLQIICFALSRVETEVHRTTQGTPHIIVDLPYLLFGLKYLSMSFP